MKNNQVIFRIFITVLLSFCSSLFAASLGSWQVAGNMNEARIWHSAVLLTNGKVLVAGGSNAQNQITNTAEIYDPTTGKWQLTGSMKHKRHAFTMSILPDGKVLALGGTSDTVFSETSAEIYDPATGLWTETASTSTGRRFGVSLLITQGALAGKVIVAGGDLGDWGGHTITQKVELYDPVTGIWSPTGDMLSYRYSGGLLMLPDNSLFMVGGIDCCGYTWLNKVETFNQNTETWTALDNKTTFAQEHAVLLPNQQVLVAGGAKGTQGSSRSVPDAELFNPSTKVWTKTASMSVARDSYTLTLLNNGQVLAVGGNNGGWGICNDTTPNAELYDYHIGKWTATDPMNATRNNHTATLLPNGQVLVAGGANCSGARHASAELYTPITTTSYNLTTQTSINLDFGTNYDAKNSKFIELQNTSTSPIEVSNVVISDAKNYWANLFVDSKWTCRAKNYTATSKKFTIPAQSSCLIGVGFSPFDDASAGNPITATLTLNTLINGVATDKTINLTGTGRAKVATLYSDSTSSLNGRWAVTELKGGNPPLKLFGKPKTWYGDLLDAALQKKTAQLGNVVVFAGNSAKPMGKVGIIIQTSPIVVMLTTYNIKNQNGSFQRKWVVKPIAWYRHKHHKSLIWEPLLTGTGSTSSRHYGFIDWNSGLY